jgi:hypothetical protein
VSFVVRATLACLLASIAAPSGKIDSHPLLPLFLRSALSFFTLSLISCASPRGANPRVAAQSKHELLEIVVVLVVVVDGNVRRLYGVAAAAVGTLAFVEKGYARVKSGQGRGRGGGEVKNGLSRSKRAGWFVLDGARSRCDSGVGKFRSPRRGGGGGGCLSSSSSSSSQAGLEKSIKRRRRRSMLLL